MNNTGIEVELKFTLSKLPAIMTEDLDNEFDLIIAYAYRDKGELRVVQTTDIGCFLTVKDDGGLSRREFEVRCPEWVFNQVADYAPVSIHKHRYTKTIDGHLYELDVYKPPLNGLMIMEIEFPSTEAAFAYLAAGLPDWMKECGAVDVTNDPKFKNKNLAYHRRP